MAQYLGDADFQPENAGAKAVGLHRLMQMGLAVPAGFVIGHDEDLAAWGDRDLAAAVARIGGFPVAVRSSGVLEDLADASFAGQYETFLSVADLGDLRAKIAACRASAESPRVQAYLARAGKSAAEAKVGVVVQRMVDARLAGVGFTLDPMSGREEHALVEYVSGLGERLVSGHASPSREVIGIVGGASVSREIGPDGAVLSDDERARLARMFLHIQASFHAPQDVEWALDTRGELYALQSRPITKVTFRTDVEEFTNADFKDGGISARVCTPLMYSLYRNAVQTSMQRYFESLFLVSPKDPPQWIAMFYGRGYWNASAVKRALGHVPGFQEESFDRDLGIQKSYGARGPSVVPTTASTLVRALPVAFALDRSYARQLDVVEDFGRTFPARYQHHLRKLDAIGQLDDARFYAALERVYFSLHARTEQAYFTTIYNNSNVQSDFKSLLASVDRATGRASRIPDLLGGLADVHHMDMQRGMLKLYAVATREGLDSPAGEAAMEAFLAEHGEHADAELDLTVPRWREAPERVRIYVERLRASDSTPMNPDDTIAEQRRRFETERDAILGALRQNPLHRVRFLGRFRRTLARVRRYLSAREKMRRFSTQTYAIVRGFTVEAGRRLHAAGKIASPAEVFFLEVEEVAPLGRGSLSREEAVERIGWRRAMYDGYRDFVPPNELGRGVVARDESDYQVAGEGGRVLQGLGCSPGIAEGTVRVLGSLDEVQDLRRGEILVTRFTDPGWTPALGLVAGVVTEVGGLLSHAAVIGREYGIPAVLNLPGATKRLKTGQRARVDGGSGRVEILAEA